MVVGDVEPFRLPILVGVNQLVCQVLLGGIFAHLDLGPSDYFWVVGVGLGPDAEELSE
jgi:hypothetical protein